MNSKKEKSENYLNRNQIEEELSKIRIEEHRKKKNCNKITGIPVNIFIDSPSEMGSLKYGNLTPILIRKQNQIFMKKIEEGITGIRVFHGVNGSGKSYSLYHLAAYFYQFNPFLQDPKINQKDQIPNQPNSNSNSFSKKQKWVVFYLNNLQNFLKKESHDVASEIMEYFFQNYGESLFQKCKFNFDKKFWFEDDPLQDEQKKVGLCKIFLQKLIKLKTNEFRILIALDNYNDLFRETNQNQNQKHILDFFKTVREIQSGLIIVATSPSFEYRNTIRDIDLITSGFKSYFYNQEEFEILSKWKQKENKLPQDQTIEKFEDLTNKSPRMLYIISQTYDDLNTFSGDTRKFLIQSQKNCISHYQKRIEFILEKIQELWDPNRMRQEIEFPTMVCLNENPDFIPDFWEVAELFEEILIEEENDEKKEKKTNSNQQIQPTSYFESNLKLVPITKYIREAFFEAFEKPQISLFRFLFQSGDELRAFELVVLNIFRRSLGSKIELNHMSLQGKQRNPFTFNIKIRNIIYQDKDNPLKKMEVGDFIVCFEGHSRIDFVCLSENEKKEKELFFIQVSTQIYNENFSKVDSLFQDRDFENQTNTSILQYYSELSGMNCSIPKWNEIESEQKKQKAKIKQLYQKQKENEEKHLTHKEIQKIRKSTLILPKNHYYFYFTHQDYLETTSQFAKDPVILVNKEEIFGLKSLDFYQFLFASSKIHKQETIWNNLNFQSNSKSNF
ncbi:MITOCHONDRIAL 28S ribosomal protein S29 [Anaeramoeba ignava]|uniref:MITOCHONDRIAL 28S ribosomal protein S29 n=1 Tax=Anaeramoeba ignava TaxID=1746090 RepID=A0A9Q0RAG5_ANAIG|nr:MITOCHONDRIAL 28S ribosomal protein S29 [Anaeramoeba ignava]